MDVRTPLNPVNNLEGFSSRYQEWLNEKRSLLEAKDFNAGFKGYPWVSNFGTPFTPFADNLVRTTLAVVSTAGLYLQGAQDPFDAENIEGDWSFRELPLEARAEELAIAHTHYDHRSVQADLNAVYPIEVLGEMVAEGRIGALAPRHYSISGYCTRADLVDTKTAPAIAQRLKADGVGAVLVIPV
ncbi:MAG: glycine/betaine/sarcosine/D-proline family reductase selenoprotein B [Deltaproteobacteria bacterium]|nr:glycine/betaine/sarcosine/D-proline family reductase selenoprotein B [Deltaproteobacteria bacterium]